MRRSARPRCRCSRPGSGAASPGIHRGAPSPPCRRATARRTPGKKSVLSIERLDEPPPWEQLDPGPGRNRTWQLGARMKPETITAMNRAHDTTLGIDLSGGVASQDTWFNGRIGELVNGIPARVWDFSSPGPKSGWQQTTIAAYASDRVVLRPRLTGTAGLRFEHIGASADGGRDVRVVDRPVAASRAALGHHRGQPAALVHGLRPLRLQHAPARSRVWRSVRGHRERVPMERAGRDDAAGGVGDWAAGRAMGTRHRRQPGLQRGRSGSDLVRT